MIRIARQPVHVPVRRGPNRGNEQPLGGWRAPFAFPRLDAGPLPVCVWTPQTALKRIPAPCTFRNLGDCSTCGQAPQPGTLDAFGLTVSAALDLARLPTRTWALGFAPHAEPPHLGGGYRFSDGLWPACDFSVAPPPQCADPVGRVRLTGQRLNALPLRAAEGGSEAPLRSIALATLLRACGLPQQPVPH